MSARDELWTHIHDSAVPRNGLYVLTEDGVADELLAAGYTKPRTITTAEELDALPLESVVKSTDGNVWESLVGGWFETASRACHVASDLLLPATVLYVPAP